MKICSSCKKEKALSEFYNSAKAVDGKYPRCKDCDNIARKRWAEKNPERQKRSMRERNLKHRFGLTLEQYEQMIEDQEGKCAICGGDDPHTPHGHHDSWCVDHCHHTGKVRGLLCSKCNGALGLFQDDLDLLKKAIKYLETH